MRVSALKDVGHYSAHITEDLLTGMKLHANGWKSVYVHEALAWRRRPNHIAFILQSTNAMGYGCIDILFTIVPNCSER